jgi:predicted MFS family arabinose efflux permease
VIARVLGLASMPVDFRRLWASTISSNLADGIVGITFALAAVRLTTDPFLVASVAVAAGIPPVLLVLFAGVLADRVDRRGLLLGVQLARIVILGGLALLTIAGGLSLPMLVLGAFTLSVAQTFYDTTSQAILPMVAGDTVLTRANARLFAAETLTDTFLGPPLGGALVAIGIPLAFGGATLGYALAAVGLALLVGTFRMARPGPPTSVRQEIAAGLAFLVRHRLQRTLTTMVAMGNFGSAAVFAIFVLYAVAPGPMRLSEVEYGLLLTAMGAGSLVGSTITERVERRLGTARSLILSQVGFAVAFFVPALTSQPLVVALGFFVAGIAIMIWNVVNVSLRQRFIPPGLYGRVHASHRLVTRAAGLVGGFVGGVVAATIGLPAVFWMGGVVVLLSGLGGLVVTDRAVAEAVASSEPTVTRNPA